MILGTQVRIEGVFVEADEGFDDRMGLGRPRLIEERLGCTREIAFTSSVSAREPGAVGGHGSQARAIGELLAPLQDAQQWPTFRRECCVENALPDETGFGIPEGLCHVREPGGELSRQMTCYVCIASVTSRLQQREDFEQARRESGLPGLPHQATCIPE
jgi:hypothetical protein